MMNLKIFFPLLLFLFFSVILFSQNEDTNDDEDIKILDSNCIDQILFSGNEPCLKIDSIVNFALSKIGCKYKYGCNGPAQFDCSGLMYHTFGHFGITLQRSSRDQYKVGKKVKKDEILRGDLVFFMRGKKGNRYIGHVGLVIDVDSNKNFRFVHASSPKYGVKIDESTRSGYIGSYAGARRIIECEKDYTVSLPLQNGSIQPDTTNDYTVSQKDSVTLVHTQPVKQPDSPKIIYHRVRKGDTLSSISRKYHVSVDKIKKWNRLKSDLIRIDQRLKIYR